MPNIGEKHPTTQSPLWQVTVVLLGAPALQALFFLLSGTTFEVHSRFAFLSGMVMLYLCFALVLWFMRQRGARLADLGFSKNRWGREVLMGIGAGILLFLFSGLLFVGIEKILPSAISREPRPLWATLIYGFALITAFAPIEEIIWRGYAIKALEERFKKRWLAVLVASVGFGLVHWWGGLGHVVAATIIGLAFSILYLWRKNLLTNIVAHFVTDLPLFLFLLFPVLPQG